MSTEKWRESRTGGERGGLGRPALLGVVGVAAMVVGAVLGGTAFVSHLPGAWFFGTPGGPLGSWVPSGRHPSVFSLLLVFGGLILLTRAWLGLYRLVARKGGVPVRQVAAVLALWILPLLLAPPLFSRDAYSYAGQGEMVSHHIDPYDYGPGVLGGTPFNTLAGPLWSNTPSPYGPAILSLDGVATDVSGHGVLADLLLLRLIELGGVALMVAGLPTLARALGRDPATAVVLGAASPLVLTSVVGGAHNEGLMVGLLVAGLAVARRVGPVPGILLCALAAGVKAPAIVGVVVLGWAWAACGATAGARVRRAVASAPLALGTLEALALVTGLGWGWVGALTSPGQVQTGVTPITALSRLAAGLVALVHLPVAGTTVRTVGDVLGLLAAAAIGVWCTARWRRLGIEKAVALALLALAFLSPVLWPWYLTWGLVPLAAVAVGRLRRAMIVITVLGAFVGVTAVAGLFHTLVQAGLLYALLVAAAATVVVTVPLGLPSRRPGPGGTDSGSAPELEGVAAESGGPNAPVAVDVLSPA